MANIKHVGKIKNTQKRVVVMFRELPGDSDHCLVVDTDALPDWMHDNIISAVESPGAQQSANFYEYAQRTVFTDGSNMLTTLHNQGRLQKQATSNIIMTPNNSVSIALNELNDLIREQTGGAPVVRPDDDQLSVAASDAARNSTSRSLTESAAKKSVVDNSDIARNMLAQAEQFRAEAERLVAEAYEIDPSLKPKAGRKKAVKETADN
jgi:hypothetical protein